MFGSNLEELLGWNTSEVMAYLEEKILDEIATNNEVKLYNLYMCSEQVNKNSKTYKRLIAEMRQSYMTTDGVY